MNETISTEASERKYTGQKGKSKDTLNNNVALYWSMVSCEWHKRQDKDDDEYQYKAFDLRSIFSE